LFLIRSKNQFTLGLGILLAVCFNISYTAGQVSPRTDSTKVNAADTVKRNVNNPYFPTFRPQDRYGDPFSNTTTFSPLFLKDPKSLSTDVQIDTAMNYTIFEKIGDVNYRPTSSMSFEEFKQQQDRIMRKTYWQSRSKALDGESAVTGRNLAPKLYIGPSFDRLFGGSYVSIIPRGFVTLDFAGSFQKIENPQIPLRQQKNGGFEFDQQINLSVVGKVGEKMAITTNFDTNNSFDFQNNMKVEYTGSKEDILKKLEIGNVSLPLNNSLISGAQNLFGVKAQMQFGKLFVTSMATTQRGKQSSIEIQGNTSGTTQARTFDYSAALYDENRHFFLSQFFRDNFEGWLSTLPQITSGVNITRVEVYLMNRNNDTQTQRNVVGFMDMGESDKIYRKNVLTPTTPSPIAGTVPTANSANNLFDLLGGISAESDGVNAALEGLGFVNGTDFEKVTSARKLAPTEYTFHKTLGYVTLQRKLQNDEALVVAYEYTYQGKVYKVGELTEDYSNKKEDEVVYVKLLRPRKISIKDESGSILPTWNLMMKNIYNLNVTQLQRDNFQLRIIYRDDKTGIDNPQLQEGDVARTKQLIEVVGLDRLNPYNDPQPDGNFDFVENVTVNTETGLIIFPYLEPFNKPFRNLFENESQKNYLVQKYVYDTLYHTTQAEAILVSTKNKFFLIGSSQSGSGKDVTIPGFNISPGSVRVLAGGMPLIEGVDYTVDYTFGKVTILNEGILSSGKNISVTYEQQDPFSFQTRSLLGTRFDYKLNDAISFGSTFLYYNERPLISRNSIGAEPARNMQYGFDVNLKKNSRVLTKIVDALPFLQTKEVSTLTLNAEVAQLLPGTSNVIDGTGTSFVDDFENTATPYSLMTPSNWKLAAVPKDDPRFDLSLGASDDLRAGYKRAKLAWYMIDPQFYGTGRYKPSNITDKDLENHYVRQIQPNEIFPYFDNYIGNFNEPIFELAFYPEERGPYNYNPDLNANGTLKNPVSNWGGVTTAFKTEVDFDKANIEYVEFWLMDPFINNENGRIDDGRGNNVPNTTGGQLVFQLGSISEDVMRDGKHAFENGLPPDGNLTDPTQATRNNWGYVTNQQYLNNAFNNDPEARANQDVGLDGVNSALEASVFSTFVNAVNPQARPIILEDPSSDNFSYFFGDELDAKNAKILERYKNFNGMENNTPIIADNNDVGTFSGTTIPENEDLNQDNTLSDLEEYYSYNLDLKPGQLDVGKKFIVDKIVPEGRPDVTWYLFRIPVRQFDEQHGGINGFKSIRYARMYMNGFSQPVVLRMSKFKAVGNRWRTYTGTLKESDFGEVSEPDLDKFSVSVVNVEENGQESAIKPAYVPPLKRDRDVTSTVNRRLNEQSVQLCTTDLPDGDARAIYKNVSMDFFNYGRINMFLSAYEQTGKDIPDNELTAFIRLGTDFDQNYYEIELPLRISKGGQTSLDEVWPEQNQIDLDLNELYGLKAQRDREGFSLGELYPQAAPLQVGKHNIRLLGRPDLSQVKLIMIGVRNPRSDDTRAYSVCMWANELRLTDFDTTPGWATNLVGSAKLADLGQVTGSLRYTTFGYGGVQSKISERTRSETLRYDVSANLNVDKLLPKELGLKIPMFASFENTIINPNFDPANPDLRLPAALSSYNTEAERNAYLSIIQDNSTRRSLNFTNVRKVKLNKNAKSHIYDIENFAFTYAYSEANQTNFNLRENTKKSIKGSIAWQYNSTFKGFEPFKNSKALSSPWLQLIKDFNFNPMPTSISLRGDLDRSFNKLIYRNSTNDAASSIPNYQKYLVFNRFYNVRWNLTKSLTVDYNATVNAIVDEPDGDLDNKDSLQIVLDNLKKFGRMKNYSQTITANYTVPLDKLPLTNWIGVDYRYNVMYGWRAGPLETNESLQLGNIIQNSRDQAFNGKIDLLKLYNKSKFFKEVNTPKRAVSPAERARQAKTDTLKPAPSLGAVRGLLRLIMSVRNITGTYSVTEGTTLPGFTKTPYLFGMDKTFTAPGWDFIFGSQSSTFPEKASDNGWLTTNEKLTNPFLQAQQKNLSLRSSIEPSTDFKIQLDAKKMTTAAFQEIYRFEADSGGFVAFSPSRTGTYTVSTVSVRTAFKNNTSINSTVFEQFEANRAIVAERLQQQTTGTPGSTGNEYQPKSQDVLIPAFIAAYTGQSANQVTLSPFPRLPLPNWRIDYTGLIKLGSLQEIFQSITINHAYASSYTVGNYTNSLEYGNVGINVPVEKYNQGLYGDKKNASGEAIPIYVVSQALISEQFAPLFGINVRTKKKLTARFEYKTKRDLSLNISNAQITELNTKDWSVQIGYTKNNLKLPFKDQGRTLTLKNDVTFQLAMSVSDNRSIQRKIEEINTITNGNVNFQLRPNINYLVNQKLNIQLYMERNVNDPLVTNSYPRSTTKVGTKIIFQLSQ